MVSESSLDILINISISVNLNKRLFKSIILCSVIGISTLGSSLVELSLKALSL